jgi:hypothetical protein
VYGRVRWLSAQYGYDMVYGCKQTGVRSTQEVSGEIFDTELSLHRDVIIRLAVTPHWTRQVTVRQP